MIAKNKCAHTTLMFKTKCYGLAVMNDILINLNKCKKALCMGQKGVFIAVNSGIKNLGTF